REATRVERAPAQRQQSERRTHAAIIYHRRMADPRLVLVTGAAGAIGGALAHALAARFPGAHLALSDIADISHDLGDRASTWRWDLTRPAELEARWAELV